MSDAEPVNPFASPEVVAAKVRRRKQHSEPLIFESAHRRAIVALSLGGCWMLVTVAWLWGNLQYYRMLEAFEALASHELVTPEVPTDLIAAAIRNGQLRQASFFGLLALGPLGTIAYFTWLHRAYRNLQPLGARGLTQTPWLAIRCYFARFTSFFKPYEGMKEIVTGSDPKGLEHITGFGKPPRAILLTWWCLFVVDWISLVFSIVTATTEAGSMDAVRFAITVILAHGCVSLAVLALTMWLVWRVDQDQAERAVRVEEIDWAAQTSGAADAASPSPADDQPLDWSNFNFDK